MNPPDFCSLVKARLQAVADGDPMSLDHAMFGELVSRQLRRREERNGLSISALGNCARQIGYRLMDEPPNGRTIDARALMTFAIGDYVEAFLTTVLANALPGIGWKLTQYGKGQGRVELEMCSQEPVPNKKFIPGHRDGVLVGPDGEECVLEVKSMSSYAFTFFQKAGGWPPSESYYWQHQGYLHASNIDVGYALAACKDSGALAGFWTRRDERFIEFLARHLEAAEQGERKLPDLRELKPDEKGRLPWQCLFCQWHKSCWPEGRLVAKRDFRGRPSNSLYVPIPTQEEKP